MKFAIYGVSRSGKDFFITKLVEFFKEKGVFLKHIKGSETLNDLALKKYNNKFKFLNDEQQSLLRKEFVSFVKSQESQFENVIVDGHFSFYDSEKNLVSVFSKYDLECYDKFFYLDADSNKVVEYSKSSVGEKKNDFISEKQVDVWKNYEIEGLENALINENKDLHIVKYIDDFTFQYVFDVILLDKYNSYKAALKMVEEINTDNVSSVIVTDCDKTLSYEDTTNIMLENGKNSKTPLKDIFKGDRYSPFQFALANEYYKNVNAFTETSVEYAIDKTTINNEIFDDLKSKKNCLILGVTAGNTDTWQRIFEKYQLNATVLHATDTMSKYLKYFVVKILKERGKFVIGIGDSMLDSLMIKNADVGYIATTKGYRGNIEGFLRQNTHVRGLSCFEYKYEFINTDNGISSIKTLTLTDEVNGHIEVCKSNSGADGRELRSSHYHLGKSISQLIEKDFPKEDFALIIMLRSGVPFGMGIGDYLDCPILFYDEHSKEKTIQEIKENEKLSNRKFILCDAVINSGKSIENAINDLSLNSPIIATTVISDKYNQKSMIPIYSVRLSQNSYVGTKQKNIANGKGPDTSDRLFKLI